MCSLRVNKGSLRLFLARGKIRQSFFHRFHKGSLRVQNASLKLDGSVWLPQGFPKGSTSSQMVKQGSS